MEDEPIYVNSKQYSRILKRRLQKAKQLKKLERIKARRVKLK